MQKRILVTQSSMPPIEEYIEEIKELWDSRWITNMGKKHMQLVSELCSIFQVPYTALFTNGHLALEACVNVMNLKGEVITTPYTFVSTTHAISRNNLIPVFCDISPDTYTIDANKIEELITPKTSAILAVHVYGNICDVTKIQEIADRHHLKVIYDAAHAFNETYEGKSIASFGDASMFSFHATKVFHTIEGGAISTSDKRLYENLCCWRNFGFRKEGRIDEIGANAKMNEFQAAMGLCNLRHLDMEIALRKAVVEQYNKNLQGLEGVKLPTVQKGLTHNYAYYPVIFEKELLGISRNDIADELKKHGIYPRKYFYPLTSNFSCYQKNTFVNHTPVAEHIADSVLTLPLYAHLPLETVDKISMIITDIVRGKKC